MMILPNLVNKSRHSPGYLEPVLCYDFNTG